MPDNFREFQHMNVPLHLIRHYAPRCYTVVESKVILWMAILEDPKNWRGYVTARPLPDGTYELLTGHHRFNAALRLGWETLPLEIGEYSDVDAAGVHNTDNSLAFAPTAGMAIGAAPGSIKLYERNGLTTSEARDKVRQSLGLEKESQLDALLAMHAALEAGTFTEKIRDVLDILAAIAFWEKMVKWADEVGEFASLELQASFIAKANPNDIRRDLARVVSKQLIDYRIHHPKSAIDVVRRSSKRQKSLTEKMTALVNVLAKLTEEAKLTDEEEVFEDILVDAKNNFNALMATFEPDDEDTDA